MEDMSTTPSQINVAIDPDTHERLKAFCASQPMGGKLSRVATVAINAFLDAQEPTPMDPIQRKRNRAAG